MPPSTIGKSLRAARRRRGWTREELAHRASLSVAAIAQIETGRRTDVRISSVVALADALEVSVDHLAGVAVTPARVTLRHRALIYRDADEFLAGTAGFLQEALERGEGALAVAGQERIDLLRDALGAQATDVELYDSAAWYSSPLDALARYRAYLEEQLAAGSTWMRIVGEPVWNGRSPAETIEWIRYESIINLVFASAPATIVCPYDAASLPADLLELARCTHPELAGPAAVDGSADYIDPEELLIRQAHAAR